MGLIDTNSYTLSCNTCRSDETAKAKQHGSTYGASWAKQADFQKFSVSWNGSGQLAPIIISATCKTCGQPAATGNLC